MFSQTATFVTLLAAALVGTANAASVPGFPSNGAIPVPVGIAAPLASRRTDSSCNTGPVQCCQNIQDADAPFASQLLALLGVQVQDVNVPVGIQCNPITVIGAGSASCEAEPVCCENNNYQGLIALGCLPINVGL